MSLLTEIFCTVSDLLRLKIQLEAKSLVAKFEDGTKSLHCCMMQLCFWVGMLIFCIALLAGGVGFIMWGTYALLALAINPGFAALIVGLIVSLIATIILIAVKNSIKKSR
ncbi:MAG: hypothetical protein JW787_02695 [Sedimentisphaerales bacterium]|nr:hypothetical protein [Sedimentisphaerales bacterium]